MDQLKVKDRILENISLSVKKVSSAQLVSVKILSQYHKEYFSHALMTAANIRSFFCLAKEGTFESGALSSLL